MPGDSAHVVCYMLELYPKDNHFRMTYTYISIANKGFLYFFSAYVLHLFKYTPYTDQ